MTYIFKNQLPIIFVAVFILIVLFFDAPNPYEIPATLGWLSNPTAETLGGHCSMSIPTD